MLNIAQFLFDNKDEAYKHFQCKLMPTVDPDTVIGVRTPLLRTFAKKINGSPESSAFLAVSPTDITTKTISTVCLSASLRITMHV